MEKYEQQNKTKEIVIPETKVREKLLEQKSEDEIIIEKERGLLSRFRGKAGKIARCLVLMSVFSVGGKLLYEGTRGETEYAQYVSDQIKDMDREEMLSYAGGHYDLVLNDTSILSEIQKRSDRADIIKKAIEIAADRKEFRLVLKKYDLYKNDKEFAKKLIEKAAEAGGDDYVVEFGDAIYEYKPDFVNSGLKRIYEKRPDEIFENLEKLIKIPFVTEEVIERSARHAAKRGSPGFLKNFHFIEGKPYAKVILNDCVQLMEAYGFHNDLLQNFGVFKNESYAEEILNDIYKKRPGLVASYFENYKGLAFAEEVLEKSLRRASADSYELPEVFRSYWVYQDKPYSQEILKMAAENGAELNPGSVLKFGQFFLGNPYAEKVVRRAAEKDPNSFLSNYETYKDMSYAKSLLKKSIQSSALPPENIYNYLIYFENEPYAKKALEAAVDKDPGAALPWFQSLQDLDYGEEILERASRGASKKYPFAVFKYLDFVEKQDYGPEVINAAISRSLEFSPKDIIRNANKISKLSNGREFIVQAVKSNPFRAIRWDLTPDLKEVMEREKDPAIKALLQIDQRSQKKDKDLNSSARINLSTAVLLEKIINEKMTLEEAQKTFDDRNLFFKALIEIKSKPDHLAKFDVEQILAREALYQVQTINYLHNSPDEKRFKSIKDHNPQKLYTLMVYGEEEIFTSSFNGIFNRLLDKMEKENISGDKLLSEMGYNKFRNFIKLCSGFNRLQEFLDTMDANSQKKVLEMFINSIEKEPDMLSQAVVVADVFSALKEPEILKVFQKQIKKEYERVKNEKNSEGMAVYGLLAGMFGDKAVINEPWLKEMSKKYKLPSITELSSKDLFNKDGSNIQQYFFYDDEDGKASFQSFLAQYKGSKEWNIIGGKDKYIVIKSKDGRVVEIFANKPEHEDEGTEEISKLLKKRSIQSIVVVHRGHSYHAQKTIDRIPPVAKVVSLGSCGGYNNIDGVLQKAPDAHILSTKGTGTMLVNDPILKIINEQIKAGKDLNWPDIWTEADKKLGNNPNFQNYVPPS